MEYLDMDFKTYRCSMLLGKETDSRDVWGDVLSYVPEDAVNEMREEKIRVLFFKALSKGYCFSKAFIFSYFTSYALNIKLKK